MKLRTFLLPVLMVALQAVGLPHAALASDAGTTPLMVVSYWGYIGFMPLMAVAFAVHGWRSRRKD